MATTHTFSGSDLVVIDRKTGETKRFQFEVEIDITFIIRHLGRKAVANKSKRASEISGAVVVKVRP